jgi:hypothetical protein
MSAPVPEDERTLIGSASGGVTLPLGYKLQEFVNEGVLGEGGFGIVYRAHDTVLQRPVAIKEYMPATLAARDAGFHVHPRSEGQREPFDVGLRSFINEARLLASFDHPSLVKVYRFWEENGTAYMVMPLYKGATLKQWLRDTGVRPSEAWLLELLRPLSAALELLHGAEPCCLHRDVAPDNVLLLGPSRTDPTQLPEHPRPLLLDFGAARQIIGDMTRTLTVVLKPGYAPIEQYGEVQALKQGPWTDVYALAAVLYACITGRAPMASVDRVLADDLVPAVTAGAGRYSTGFLLAIDAGLRLRPEERPQSMLAFRRMFTAGATGVAAAAPAALPPRATPPPAAATARSHAPLGWGAAAAAMLAIGATAWWSLRPAADEAGKSPVAASAVTPASVAAKPAVVAPSAPQAAASATSAPTTADAAFTVLGALQDLVAHADPSIRVGASVEQATLVIDKDALRFRVRASEAGHLYVYFAGTDKRHFHLLFPNRLDRANRIEPGTELRLPRKGWEITAAGPPGTNHLVMLVSREPRDLLRAGLRSTGEAIPEFDLAEAERLWRQRAVGTNPFAGEPLCTVAACSGAYGATMLTVDEVAAPAKAKN